MVSAVHNSAQNESAAPVARLSGIRNCFGEECVHDDLSLELPRGRITALVGGSGSGKTVLLRTLSMLRRPDAGQLELFGKDALAVGERGQRDLRRRIGLLFQGGALFTALTVLENVMLPMREHTSVRGHWLEELAMSKVLLAGLPADSAGKYPAELSGGMVKRAALARALALDPSLLILDEPTSGLDPIAAAGFDALIRELTDSLGLTVIQATHDLDSIWRGSDLVAFLARKRVLAFAPAAELAQREEQELVAYFRGERSAEYAKLESSQAGTSRGNS
ncbi:ATP-binding cassette domain-containing protein [Guyparkeria halophila]|uniref:ATP-binding cassette domain-containing protein n=1 Tax=Guyparkeria halophila TaxID=47960 RepID=A0ABZ0YU95_9GAMM|nr:ATP-binding cassette domain-containing protein [Guyparkeria halophila]WQH15303.1 ATP-binding cassette domain-containing protein [Guyparkeria halophila]